MTTPSGWTLPALLKAIVFDVDGTLYRQAPVRRGMAARLLKECARHPVRGWKTSSLIRAYRNAQEELRRGADTDVAEEQLRLACRNAGFALQEGRERLRVWFEEEPLDLVAHAGRPGLREFLAGAAERQLRLGVFSDYPAERKLQALGVREYFHCACCAQQSEVGEFKPSPKGILFAAQGLGATPRETLYVGDRVDVDVAAARQAGIAAVLIGTASGASGEGWIGVREFHELGTLLGFLRRAI